MCRVRTQAPLAAGFLAGILASLNTRASPLRPESAYVVGVQTRSGAVLCLCLGAGVLGAQDDPWAEDLAQARAELKKGRLAQARQAFEAILEGVQEPEGERPSAPVQDGARIGLMAIHLRQGGFAEVAEGYGALGAAARQEPEAVLLQAQGEAAQGRYEAALALLAPLLERDPTNAEASFRQGVWQRELGRSEPARQTWRAAADRAAAKAPPSAAGKAFVARCLIELAGRDDLERASQWVVDALGQDQELSAGWLAFGLLKFLAYGEAAGYPSGEKDLKKALDTGGDDVEVLLALYRLRRANFMLDPGTTESYLQRALALNPRSVDALVERASLWIDDRQFEEAERELDGALQVNPRDRLALAHRMSAALLQGDAAAAAGFRARALAADATWQGCDRVHGEHLVALYRFADAVPCFEQALRQAPSDVAAMHGLAKALIYTGQGARAVEWLHKARDLHRGRVDPWRNNALAVEQLLQSEYTTVARDGFQFLFHKDDAEVLAIHLVPLHAEAFATLGSKYGYRSQERLRIEVLNTWTDFSVRTIGFRGFSALGACFGPLITLVSPGDADLRRQDFMWAATVWHEYAHVLTLALSRQRVPRWLTEGISVYEEKQRDPTWERGMERELLDAWHNKDIVPLRLMNRLFRGPRILFGYYQGGLVVEHLAARHGFAKVLDLVRSFGADRPLEESFRAIFGQGTKEFDAEFLDWVWRTRLAHLRIVPHYGDLERLQLLVQKEPADVATRVRLGWALLQRNNPIDAGNQLREALRRAPGDPRALLLQAEMQRRRNATAEAQKSYAEAFAAGHDDFDSRLNCGRLLLQEGEPERAIEQFEKAKLCWPGCTDQKQAPELLLYRVRREAGDEDAAMRELETYCARTGRAFQPRLELAAWHREHDRREAEVRLLEQAARIDPFMRELHERLADALVALGKRERAVEALQVALAVRPAIDRAWLDRQDEIPDADAPAEREARAGICVRLAELLRSLRRDQEAYAMLKRTRSEAPDSDAARRAAELEREWAK